MEYLSKGKFLTKKNVDDFLIKASNVMNITDGFCKNNLNPNFEVVATLSSSFSQKYDLEIDDFGVKWVKVKDNYSARQGYPTCISINTIANTRYKFSVWVDTNKEVTVRLQNGSNNSISEHKLSPNIEAQKIEHEFTATGKMTYRLFFAGDFVGVRFTEFAIERVL